MIIQLITMHTDSNNNDNNNNNSSSHNKMTTQGALEDNLLLSLQTCYSHY